MLDDGSWEVYEIPCKIGITKDGCWMMDDGSFNSETRNSKLVTLKLKDN